MSDPPPSTRAYVLAAAGCGLALAVPFLAVTFPPITDLPQQTAQIRLLGEALAGAEDLRVQWLHPNKLGYLPVAAAWGVAGPLAAGRLALLVIGLLWVVAIHALARAHGRPPAAAVLATLFFFNHTTYWGFLNFLIGLPAFVLWHLAIRRPGGGPRILLAGLVLYYAHVLWLAAGMVWLVVSALLDRRGVREVIRRLAWLAPILAAVAVWYMFFSSSGVDERTFWGRPPWMRLHPQWMLLSAFGGLRGSLESALAVAVLAWSVLGLWQHRARLASAGSGRLALAGALFLLAALVLPGVHRHTIFFAARWVPAAAVFLVLACPAPRWRRGLASVVPWLLLVVLTVATTTAWRGFEREDLSGLEECLAELPAGQRVLGLAMIRESPRIQGYPYYHLYAYAQVLRGGELNRSFAVEPSSLVVFRDLPKKYPWTDDLDWRPERFRQSDRDFFEYIIVHAGDEKHAFFLRDPRLEPATAARPWRLYRVRRPATAN